MQIEYLNIKPENILINKENIKLIDYGMKFIINDKVINAYMSPELFKNQINLKKIIINQL